MSTGIVTPALLTQVRSQFRLDWHGVHGAPHWARVRRHGLYLARQMQADARVAELFAFLHDSRRHNDHTDPAHGERAADYALSLRQPQAFARDDSAMDLLLQACRGHSDGHVQADVTVQVCWDADRLDLGRVGITPDARYLCTSAAKGAHYMRQALQWSRAEPRRDIAEDDSLHLEDAW